MTHSSDYTNGASLEDCLTNVLALFDLSGIKWRRFRSDSIYIDILDDPILLTYSECISSGVLAAWRRISNQKHGSYHMQEENNSISCFKELWIFWCGDDPDFTRLLKSNLYETEQGSWESGLSYEGRTLFFKALHNAVERGLLSHGYARFGKYFITPQKLDTVDLNRKAKAISFHFFIHGESTVCSSIDIRLMPPVYILHKCHITAAQAGHQGIKVILCPYGLAGKLTGNGYKYSDPNMARFLNEWNNFFPQYFKRDQWKMDGEYPHVVEVLACGARMKYPISYVFVTEEDHLEAFTQHQTSPSGNFSTQTVQPALKTNHLYSSLLTPPMSPNDDQNVRDKNYKYFQNNSFESSKDDSLQKVNTSNCVSSIKRAVFQECCTSVPSDKSDDSALWDFQDPSAVLKCICSRIAKKFRKRSGASSTVEGPLHSSSSIQKNLRNERFGSHHIGIPFHRQKPSILPNDPINNTLKSFKNSSNSDGTSGKSCNLNSNLPQLQTSIGLLKSESLPNATAEAFYAPAATLDPAMPTLSPQPPVPVLKEENGSHFLDSSLNNISNSSVDSPQGVALKGKISDEILSPFHASLLNMFENAKNVSKASPPIKTESNQIDEADSLACQNICNVNSISQIIERPHLPKRQHEDSDGAQPTMTGMLYDYQHLNSPLWAPPSAKKNIYTSQRHFDPCDNESDCDDNIVDNSYDMKKSVPCIPKDPYEFTDIDETAPSEKGFRSITESFCKEEETFTQYNIPSPVENSPAIPPQEVVLTNLNDTSGKVQSPPTKNFCPKFIREEDLAVSLNDLENIFDTSSSEEDNAESNITPAKLPTYEEFSAKIELSHMYPTPPSLEQNAVPSPFGISTNFDCAMSENDALKENQENDIKMTMIMQENEEIDVWVPPLAYTFPESPEYSLKELPFFHNINSDLVYKPSYHNSNNSRANFPPSYEESVGFEKHAAGNLQPVLVLGAEQTSSLYNHENSQDYLMSQSTCDSVSSSHMSYANKSIGSSNSNLSHPALEIHPLIVNLLLSDSMLNIFKDINFSCCCICVCNMNIKGSDVGVILPSSLIPSGNNEPQYKCICGFSALVHRHKSYNDGLFYEDEVEIYGADCDTVEKVFGSSGNTSSEENSKSMPFLSDNVPDFILDVLKINSKSMNSAFNLLHKSKLFRETKLPSLNSLEFMDGCEVCFMALEEGKNAMDNPVPSKLDESFKSSCLHKWPYISSPMRASSTDVLLILETLIPLLQVAIHRKNMQKMLSVTYVVPAPLTWKEFHRLAPRGTEDQCEPQPIPFTLAGHDGDCSILSPFSIRLWDKLHLEPYSPPRDVAYIVVAPENDSVLSHIKNFFRELSCCYELHNLGKHRPITKVLRDGIMRVGKTAASKVAEAPISEWFSSIGDGPIPNKLRLYARVFKHRLAPHLSTLPLDKSIFDPSSSKATEKISFSSVFSSSDSSDRPNTPRLLDSDNHADNHLSNVSSHDPTDDDEQQCPALVIYVVEPFTFGQFDAGLYRLVTLGLIHSYADMLSALPESIKNSINLQLISLDSIMSSPSPGEKRNNDIKALAFSIFSQSHSLFTYQSSVKSLTGFGPAAAQNLFLKKNLSKVPKPLKEYNQPYILASLKDKQTELGEMFGDGRENSGTLFCSYCLSKNKKFILASCTNDKGEFTETNIINIGIPNRHKRKHTSVLKFGLCKLLEFVFEVMSISVYPWRLIIERFGRLGQGELKTWASLLSRKSLHSYSKRLRDMCGQCSISGVADVPCILSVCLVSLEPDSTLRLMPDQIRIVERFGCSRSKNCHLSTPEDASCTHILVFPTSATTQSSQVTFHQEHIDPLPGGLGEDFFEALNDEDINNPDINEIFKWTDSPQSPGNSPHQESNNSQPSSPNAFKHSFTQEGTNQYPSMISNCQDEPLQLLQQPLALGYYVSTAKSGNLPKWFWSSCPHGEHKSPAFLKSSLLIHLPYVQKSSDELLQSNPQQQLMCHPMDSNFTTDVLRYVLEGHNTLSWLALDSNYRDRRSCLPIHIQTLIQLYDIVEAIL